MDYANFSKRPFVVKKEIQKRKKVSPELKRRREFFANHSLKIFVDPATNEVKSCGQRWQSLLIAETRI